MKKVSDVKKPLKKGEIYLVPCIVTEFLEERDEQDIWMDLNNNRYNKIIKVTPVFDHPHSDVENGQDHIHYHMDYRFFDFNRTLNGNFRFLEDPRPLKTEKPLKLLPLKVCNEDFTNQTPVDFIKNSELNWNNLNHGRCPHKGFDLSQVNPDGEGYITCPLHGLKIKHRNCKFKNLSI